MPVRQNVTRWSSKLQCLLQWLQLRGPIDKVTGFPEEVIDLIPSTIEHQSILTLVEDMKKFDSISMALQAGGLSASICMQLEHYLKRYV